MKIFAAVFLYGMLGVILTLIEGINLGGNGPQLIVSSAMGFVAGGIVGALLGEPR